MARARLILAALGMAILQGCGSPSSGGAGRGVLEIPRVDRRDGVVEARSLLGGPLARPALGEDTQDRLQADLDEVWDAWAESPRDEMRFVWLGRRLAYLGRYGDAIEVYSAGLAEHPGSYRLLRHRGHRYITTRRFELAIADLAEAERIVTEGGMADEVEPDGAPNELGIPLTTTHSNIFYHLALAQYLRGDYEEALATHRRGERFGRGNDDGLVSGGYWVYRCLRELGREGEARGELERVLRPEMEIIENHAYLAALRAYRAGGPYTLPDSGDRVRDATLAYGLAAELVADGREREGLEMMESIVARGEPWAAFGFIASEARLARR